MKVKKLVTTLGRVLLLPFLFVAAAIAIPLLLIYGLLDIGKSEEKREAEYYSQFL